MGNRINWKVFFLIQICNLYFMGDPNLFVPGQAKTVKHAPVAVGPVSVSVCGPQII